MVSGPGASLVLLFGRITLLPLLIVGGCENRV